MPGTLLVLGVQEWTKLAHPILMELTLPWGRKLSHKCCGAERQHGAGRVGADLGRWGVDQSKE